MAAGTLVYICEEHHCCYVQISKQRIIRVGGLTLLCILAMLQECTACSNAACEACGYAMIIYFCLTLKHPLDLTGYWEHESSCIAVGGVAANLLL
jgi:hypothetical protein